METNEAVKTRRGRKPTPPELDPHYTKRSFSLPLVGFKNMQQLAQKGNSRSMTGKTCGKASWRNMLRRFAMEDIPRILQEIEELGLEFTGTYHIHFTVELRKDISHGTTEVPANTEAA